MSASVANEKYVMLSFGARFVLFLKTGYTCVLQGPPEPLYIIFRFGNVLPPPTEPQHGRQLPQNVGNFLYHFDMTQHVTATETNKTCIQDVSILEPFWHDDIPHSMHSALNDARIYSNGRPSLPFRHCDPPSALKKATPVVSIISTGCHTHSNLKKISSSYRNMAMLIISTQITLSNWN